MAVAALVALLLVAVLAIPGLRDSVFGAGSEDDPATPTAEEPAAQEGGDDAAATTGADAAPETEAPCEPREVAVAAAPGIADALGEIADGAGDCYTFAVSSTPAAQVVTTLSGGGDLGAELWVPDSTVWTELLGAEAEVTAGPVLATSPVVLAGTSQVIEGLGLGGSPAWSELLGAGAPLRVDDPQRDAPSLLTLLQASGTLSEQERGQQLATQAFIEFGRELRPAEDWRERALEGAEVIWPTSEQELARSGEGLTALVPAGGLGTLSYPVVTLDPEAAEAAQALADAATGADGVAALEQAGLRAGEDGAAPGVPGVPEPTPSLADQPGTDQVQAAFAGWQRITQPQRMLAVIDVSGSMDDEVGGVSRIDVATGAARGALGMMTGRTQVGLWAFSTDRGPDGQDWEELVPLRGLTEQVDGQTQQQLLLQVSGAITEETTTGDTGLHDTIAAAYEEMVAGHDPEFVNSVVLLTDGINDDTTGGLSEEELLERLQELSDPERPVVLVLVGMGPEVDLATLERITAAVDGRAYVAREPAEIADVFVDALMNRDR